MLSAGISMERFSEPEVEIQICFRVKIAKTYNTARPPEFLPTSFMMCSVKPTQTFRCHTIGREPQFSYF